MRCVNSRSESSKSKSRSGIAIVLTATAVAKPAHGVANEAALTGSNEVLVPLTNSLYVRGELTNTETVLVDVGTGFLVEKVGCPRR